MLVRFSYPITASRCSRVSRCELADFVSRGGEKQARVADRRASYAIFSMYVDAETNFYLKRRRTLFGDRIRAPRRFVLPAQIPSRFRLSAFFFFRVVDLLLIYSGRPSPDTRAKRPCYRSPRSPWSNHRAVRSMARVPIAKYASNDKVCRGLNRAENVAGVRDFTGRFRAVTFCPCEEKESFEFE